MTDQEKRSAKPKRWLVPKDYLTITLSSLAFIVSAVSAYFNILRTKEAVILVSSVEPSAIIGQDGLLHISSEDQGELVLANSGNRAVVISSVTLAYLQPSKKAKPECNDREINIKADLTNAVLKPNDLTVSRIKPVMPEDYYGNGVVAKPDGNGGFSFSPTEANKGKTDILIDICLTFVIATPSESLHVATMPVYRYHAQVNSWNWEMDGSEGPLQMDPIFLLKRTSTILSE